MRTPKQWLKCLFAAVVLVTAVAHSQQVPAELKNLPRYPESRVSNLPAPEKVQLFNSATGVAEPVLLPKQMPSLSDKCDGEKQEGNVTLSLVVDSNGDPRNVMFKRANGNQADILALQILLDSSFQPAMQNGSAVAYGMDAEFHLQVCVEKQAGTSNEITRLRSPLKEKLVKWRNSPAEANLAPLHMPADALADAEKPGAGFTTVKNIAHQMLDAKGLSGVFVFGLLVDEHGIGHIEKVLKSTNQALLPIAAKMILSSRYIPAMKDGMPIPVHGTEGLESNSQ